MSADNVIDTLQAWLAPPNVIGLNAVFDSAPWFTDGASWELDAQLGWGAIGVLHIDHEHEVRVAAGGVAADGTPGGLKELHYDVGLLVVFKFVVPTLEDQGIAATGYRRALNGLLDGVKVRLRQDRTAGSASGPSGLGGVPVTPEGSILLVGEGDGHGSPDITIDRDLPKRDVGIVWSNSLIRFHIVEIAAT